MPAVSSRAMRVLSRGDALQFKQGGAITGRGGYDTEQRVSAKPAHSPASS